MALLRIFKALHIEVNLSGAQGEDFTGVLQRFSAVFPTEGSQLGYCPLVKSNSDTGNARPIKEYLRRFRLWQQNEIAAQMFELSKLSVISPCESERAANVVWVRKKGNTHRMVVDSHPLDRVTVKDTYPMGNI